MRSGHDFEEAVDAVRDLDHVFVGGIFDIRLPGGSGLDVRREFCEYYPMVPALIATGVCNATLVNRAHVLGAEIAAHRRLSEGRLELNAEPGAADVPGEQS